MKFGVDISENNGIVNFDELENAGVDFVIIRLGYGNCHLDEQFLNNYKKAKEHNMLIGIYYYDYGLDRYDAKNEAQFVIDVLEGNGITPNDLFLGIWYDMEDADGWKANHGMPSNYEITAMCSEFICECNKNGFMCGIYASLSWLEDKILTELLADYIPYWCAQWSNYCDFENAMLWQFTDSYNINGKIFDGNYLI